MADYTFDEELDELERAQGGRGLRRKLEETLAENRSLKGENATYKAQELLRGEGFSLVKPEDLTGIVDPKLMKQKAETVQQERVDAQRILAKDLLAKQGLSGDELDSAVEDLFSAESGAALDGFDRLSQTVKTAGTPTPTVNLNDLHGTDAIAYGLTHRKRSKFRP